jgi:hypothetical protein
MPCDPMLCLTQAQALHVLAVFYVYGARESKNHLRVKAERNKGLG